MKNSPTSQLSLKSYLVKSQVLHSILLLSLCMIGIVIISLHSLKYYSEQNLNLIAQSLSDQVQAPLIFNQREEIPEIINDYIQRYDLASVQLTDTSGNLIYQSKAQITPSTLATLKQLQHKLISKDAGQFTISRHGVILAQLDLQSNVHPIINLINMMIMVFIACIILAIIIVWINTNFINRKLHQSLNLLTSVTDEVATQRAFHLRAPQSDIEDFNHISSSFNILLNEIQRWENQLQETNSHLEHRVLHDTLTQLPNRLYFQQRLNQLMSETHLERNFALLFIDNDNFKDINDNFGHQIGDTVLEEMAKRLSQSLRHDDFIARLGGDEFAILLPNIQHAEQAITVATHLLKTTETPLIVKNQLPIYFSFSIGIALSPHATTAEQLTHFADLAMYQAKIHKHRKWFIFNHNNPLSQ